MIQSRLDAIEELLAKPEIFSGLQSTLSRFCDIDQLLSLCAVVSKQQVEKEKEILIVITPTFAIQTKIKTKTNIFLRNYLPCS